MLRRLTVVSLLVIAGLGYSLYRPAERHLIVHAAAVLAGPLEELRPQWERDNGVKVLVTYDGSGALLGRLKAGAPGDVFIAAERSYLDDAVAQGLVTDVRMIAKLTAVIVTRPGNPKRVMGLRDLLRDDVRVSMADPEAAAIGSFTRRIMKGQGMWDQFQARVRAGGVSYQGTVSKAAGDVSLGVADASVVWRPTARDANLAIVVDPMLSAEGEEARGGVLKRGRESALARSLLNYLAESRDAMRVFAERGFGYE